jgi:hypothetical protein
MLENDDLTIQARLCGWDLFSPNWNFIKQIQATPLGSLCGLSVGLAPKFADPSWVFNVAMPHLNGTDTDDVFESGLDNAHVNKYQAGLLSKFIERAHVATQNLEPLGTLSPCLGSADSTNTLVRIVDFVRWAKVKGWSIPHELVEFVPEPAKHGDDCAIKLLASLPEVNSSSASDTGQAGDAQAAAEPVQAQTNKKTPQVRVKGLQQIEAIVAELKLLGYNPLSLPALVKGQRSAKADVAENLDGKSLFSARKAFENAWQEATRRSYIKNEN